MKNILLGAASLTLLIWFILVIFGVDPVDAGWRSGGIGLFVLIVASLVKIGENYRYDRTKYMTDEQKTALVNQLMKGVTVPSQTGGDKGHGRGDEGPSGTGDGGVVGEK